MTELADFIGIPWTDKGSNLSGCNCYGLLALVYRERLGIQLPLYDDEYQSAADKKALQRLILGHLDPWLEIPKGQEERFDGVLMIEDGVKKHIGMVVGKGKLLHIRRGSQSGIESYRSYFLAKKIVGFYRYDRRQAD